MIGPDTDNYAVLCQLKTVLKTVVKRSGRKTNVTDRYVLDD